MESKVGSPVHVWNSIQSVVAVTTPVTGSSNKFTNSPPFESSPVSYEWPNPSPTQEVRKRFIITNPAGYTQDRYSSGKVSADGCNCSDLVIEAWNTDGTFNAYTKVTWNTLTSWPTSLGLTITIEFSVGDPG
jgi:hypothetical protein